MALTAIAVIGGVLSGVSTIKQMKASKKAEKNQRAAVDAQRRADELKQNRERRQAIREARIRQARILQSGANQGALTSSGVEGGAGGITSQLSSNLSFLDQAGTLNQQSTIFSQRAMNAQSEAQTWGAAAGLGGTIFSAAGGFSQIGSTYDKYFPKAPLQGPGLDGRPIG